MTINTQEIANELDELFTVIGMQSLTQATDEVTVSVEIDGLEFVLDFWSKGSEWVCDIVSIQLMQGSTYNDPPEYADNELAAGVSTFDDIIKTIAIEVIEQRLSDYALAGIGQ